MSVGLAEPAVHDRLTPYVPRLMVDWLRETPEARLRVLDGTLVYVDISGFTSLTERLARHGKAGAEEMSDVLDECFVELLDVAYAYEAGLVKWGGDAVFLLFEGEEHPALACRAAWEMRSTLRTAGRLETSAGKARLRMSVGISSGVFQFFLAGSHHRELVIAGPAATACARMEQAASAGEILLSRATAAALPRRLLGEPKEDGVLLRRPPDVAARGPVPYPSVDGLDLASCIPVAQRESLIDPSDPEHRAVTVAFVDYSGVERVLRVSGVAGLAAALDELMTGVQEGCARNQVTFWETDVGVDGGKIMLVAGAPRSAADNEERMLRTALAAVELDTGLTLRAGVNRGHVFAGIFGPPYRRTTSVKGDAVNIAARLSAKAGPGQVIAAIEVSERTRTPFLIEPLPPFALKGKKKLVRAARILSAQRGLDRSDGSGGSPLVGRDAELGLLREALDRARGGAGSVVELVAEPGMGKSRLVAELAATGGVRVVSIACEEYERDRPYFAFQFLLPAIAEIRHDDADAGPRFASLVEHAAPQLAPWLPLVSLPFGIELPPTVESDRLDDQFRRTRLEDAVCDLLAAVLPEATLIVVEDAHWLDEESATLLRRLCRDVHARPWLVLLTRRNTLASLVAEDVDGVSIRLEPLRAEAAAVLSVQAAGAVALQPHTIAELAQRSGGNPLFLMELVAAASRTGSVSDLPDSVGALLGARMDHLSARDRRLLRIAAVIGQRVPLDLLAGALEGTELTADGEALGRLGEFVTPGDEGEVRFRHALVRDAAYEGLPYRVRRELHARIGSTIERLAADPSLEAEVLSLHFLNAQRFEEAWRFARMAGEQALRMHASVAAASFFERALEAARRVPGLPVADVAEVWEALGDTRIRLGELREATVAFRSGRRLVPADGVEACRRLLKEADVAWRLDRYPQALAWLTRSLAAVAGADGAAATDQRVQVYAWKARIRQRQGRAAEAIEWCRRAIREAERGDAREGLARAYYVLDSAYVALGRFEDAVHSARALEIYEELEDFEQQAGVLNNLGAFAYFQGRWDEALAFYARAREAWQTSGNSWAAAWAIGNVGEILSDQGQLEQAEQYLLEALAVARASGAESFAASLTSDVGRLAARRGAFADAHALLAEARSAHDRAGARGEVAQTDARIAECLLLEGKPAQALALATSTLAKSAALDGVFLLAELLERLRGLALMALGRLPESRLALDASLEGARQKGADYEAALTLDAMVEGARLEGEPASELVAERDALFRRLGIVRSTLGSSSGDLTDTAPRR